jgi:hypothetical protein
LATFEFFFVFALYGFFQVVHINGGEGRQHELQVVLWVLVVFKCLVFYSQFCSENVQRSSNLSMLFQTGSCFVDVFLRVALAKHVVCHNLDIFFQLYLQYLVDLSLEFCDVFGGGCVDFDELLGGGNAEVLQDLVVLCIDNLDFIFVADHGRDL